MSTARRRTHTHTDIYETHRCCEKLREYFEKNARKSGYTINSLVDARVMYKNKNARMNGTKVLNRLCQGAGREQQACGSVVALLLLLFLSLSSHLLTYGTAKQLR